MTKEQFDAWIAEQGGPLAVQYTTENVTVPNPAYNPDDVIGSVTGSQKEPKTITIQVQKWSNKKTGAALTLKPGSGDQQYEVVSQTGAAPATAESAAPPPTRPKPENPQIYQTWDSEKRAWVDSGPIAQKPPDAAKPPSEEPDPSDPTRTRIWDPALNGGQGGWKPGVAIAQKPTPLGQHGAKKSSSTMKRDGESIRITTYEDNFVEEETVTEETGVDEPPGAPPLDLTPGNGMTSLVAYKSWLAGQTSLSQAQRAALLTERIKLVKAAAEESAGVAGISAGIMGEQGAEARSERAQANTRLSESQGTYRSALDFFKTTGPMMGRNGPKGADVMNALLGRAKSFAQEMGGLTNTPRNPVPTQAAPYYTVPGQVAGGAPPAGGPAPAPPTGPMPAPPPGQPMPMMPQVGPAPLYAAPGAIREMAGAPAPQPGEFAPPHRSGGQPAPAESATGGQFAEMVEMMRRAGLDPAAIDMANNTAILNMLSGTW